MSEFQLVPVPCVATVGGNSHSVAFHPTINILATSTDKTVNLWKVSFFGWDGGATLEGHTRNVTSVAFSPTGRLLATGSDDNTAKLWQLSPDYSSGTCVATLEGHIGHVTSVAFHPTAAFILATGGYDGTTKMWRLSPDGTSATCVATLEGHRIWVKSVAFNSMGRVIATGSGDKTAKVWRLSPDGTSPPCVATLEGHTGRVTSVAFHPTEFILATGSGDKTAKLWRLSPEGEGGSCVATLEGHTNGVTSVAFDSSGTLLATGSFDGTAKLWHLSPDGTSATCVATLEGHGNKSGVYSVAFDSTGTLLATGGTSCANWWNCSDLCNKIKEDANSFVTIIIFAHGADVRSRRATTEQHDTLRKFTLAGKSGHISYALQDVMDSMFYLAHQLARLEHVPFTEKLKFMRTESKRQKFGERLQDMYHYWKKEKKDTHWKSLVPTADDWLSTTNVSYDHEYHFVVNDHDNPWEIAQLGIWLVDGSPRVLQGFKDVPIPPDSLRYYNIMDRIGLPQWPDVKGTITTLFDVAHRIKTTFRVKYVNFIDASCRFVHHPIAATDDVPSAGMSEIAPSTAHQPDIIAIGDIRIEKMSKQPPNLPAGWVFGKNLTTGEYVFANPVSGVISPDFPGTSADKQPKQPSDICVATLDKSNGGHSGDYVYVTSVAFHPNGTILATGSSDWKAKLWKPDGSSWTCIATLEGHVAPVNSVAFNPTGHILATGSSDRTAKLWQLLPDSSSGTCIATLEGHTGRVTSVAFDPTGHILATGSTDGTAKLWNNSGTCVATLDKSNGGHSGDYVYVTSVAFHPTAAFILATASSDRTVKLWRVPKGGSSADIVVTATLEGHTGRVTSVAFDPTGTLLATGSDDNTAKLWQLQLSADGLSATCVATLMGDTHWVNSVAFHPTGNLLATGNDNNAKLWNSGELWNKIKQENRAPGAPADLVICGETPPPFGMQPLPPPKMFGMPQTLPQGWSYVRGNVPVRGHGKQTSQYYIEYYMNDKGLINPHFPGPYKAGSKKSSKQNKKKTKRSSNQNKQNKKKTKKTKK